VTSAQIFVLAIIFMIFVVPCLTKILLSSRRRDAHLRVEEETRRANDEMIKHMEELEERIRVLERIVTDERYELRQRFKELRG
jgi:phage shock protein B